MNVGLKLKPKLRTNAAAGNGGIGCAGIGPWFEVRYSWVIWYGWFSGVELRVCFSLGSGRYHPKSVPSEVELKLSRCAVRPKYGGCKNAELYFLDSDALRSLVPD